MFTEEDFYILNHHEKPRSFYNTVKNVLLSIILLVDVHDIKTMWILLSTSKVNLGHIISEDSKKIYNKSNNLETKYKISASADGGPRSRVCAR